MSFQTVPTPCFIVDEADPRINPECSTGRTLMYDPCAPKSRLGITRDQFDGEHLDGIRHPSIAIQRGAEVAIIREFRHEDCKNRLS